MSRPLSVVVPLFRNRATLSELHRRLVATLQPVVPEFEILFVDDACPEGSHEEAAALSATDRRVRVLRHERNLGQHRAILTGLAAAAGEWVLVMDGDLQDPPEAIPRLLAARAPEVDAVFGGRFGAYESRGRLATSRAFKSLLAWLTGLPADAGLFVLLSRPLVEELLRNDLPRPMVTALIGVCAKRTVSVPVERARRPLGRSAYGSLARLRSGLSALAVVARVRARRVLSSPDAPRRILLAAAILVAIQLATTWAVILTPDSHRFLAQARSMLDGQGFGIDGVLETSLPPVYPIFLAVFLKLGLAPDQIPYLQIGLLLAAAAALHEAVRPAGKAVASLAVLLLAANPWVVRQTGYLLSETLSVLLASVAILLLVRTRRGRGRPLLALGAGAASAVLLLSSPAHLFVFAALGAGGLLATWRRPAGLASFVGGIVLVMLPWQLHCIAATGRPVATVFTPRFRFVGDGLGFGLWFRTWQLRFREFDVYFKGGDLSVAPARAFRSDRDRRALLAATAGHAMGSPESAEAFRQSARETISEAPLRFFVGLPAARAFLLWTDMPQIGHTQIEYAGRLFPWTFRSDWNAFGLPRAVQRLGKGVLSTAALGIYAGYPLLFLWLAARAVRSPDGRLLAVVFLLAFAGYTFAAAWWAAGEPRRNLHLYPVALVLLQYLRVPSSLEPRDRELEARAGMEA